MTSDHSVTVYVESNFVLELARRQEQVVACEAVLQLVREGRIDLRIPAFAVTEPFETDLRLRQDRFRLVDVLHQPNRELSRSELTRDLAMDIERLQAELEETVQTDYRSLRRTVTLVCNLLNVFPLNAEAIMETVTDDSAANTSGLEQKDALILSSILNDLAARAAEPGPKIFLTRDRDFDTLEVRRPLRAAGCELIIGFEAGLARVEAALRPGSN